MHSSGTHGGPKEPMAAGAQGAAAATGVAASAAVAGTALPVALLDRRSAPWMGCRALQAAASRRVGRSPTRQQLLRAAQRRVHCWWLLGPSGPAPADRPGRLPQLPPASLSWYPPGASCGVPAGPRPICRLPGAYWLQQAAAGVHLPPAQQQSANSSHAAARAALLMLLPSVVGWLSARGDSCALPGAGEGPPLRALPLEHGFQIPARTAPCCACCQVEMPQTASNIVFHRSAACGTAPDSRKLLVRPQPWPAPPVHGSIQLPTMLQPCGSSVLATRWPKPARSGGECARWQRGATPHSGAAQPHMLLTPAPPHWPP